MQEFKVALHHQPLISFIPSPYPSIAIASLSLLQFVLTGLLVFRISHPSLWRWRIPNPLSMSSIAFSRSCLPNLLREARIFTASTPASPGEVKICNGWTVHRAAVEVERARSNRPRNRRQSLGGRLRSLPHSSRRTHKSEEIIIRFMKRNLLHYRVISMYCVSCCNLRRCL